MAAFSCTQYAVTPGHGSRFSRRSFLVIGKWNPRFQWTVVGMATLGVLAIGAATGFAVLQPRLAPETMAELSPLHRAILDAGSGDISVAVAQFLSGSFEAAVMALAEAAAAGQRFPRPVRIYSPLDIIASREVAFGEYTPVSKRQYIANRTMKTWRSAAVSGACTELAFGPNRRGMLRRLPVYLFRSPNGSVHVHVYTQYNRCWQQVPCIQAKPSSGDPTFPGHSRVSPCRISSRSFVPT